jgi:nitrate reductase gamma subunit
MEALGSLLFRFLPPAALAALLGGLAWRLASLARKPQPIRQPLLPGPVGGSGAVARLVGLGLSLGPLWRVNPLLWALVWLTHLCLLLAMVGHLGLLMASPPAWWPWLALVARPAAQALPVLLLMLLMRRLAQPVLRRFSRVEDYLASALLLALALSGLALRPPHPGPAPGLGPLVRELAAFNPGAWPPPGWFWLHFALALALACYLPWGKLAHGLMIWGAPGLGQADTPSARRKARPPLSPEAPPEDLDQGWSREDYRTFLRDRWAGAGVHRVMGARERAHSLERAPGRPGGGGRHGA